MRSWSRGGRKALRGNVAAMRRFRALLAAHAGAPSVIDTLAPRDKVTLHPNRLSYLGTNPLIFGDSFGCRS